MTLKIKQRGHPYPATWEDKTLNLIVSQWSHRSGKSTTFLYKHLALAKAEGMPREDRMQYALAQECNHGKCGSRTPTGQQGKESERGEIERKKIRAMNKSIFMMGTTLR
jgi:hypothetical protein